MIGADPCTEASEGMLAVDDAGFLLCGEGALNCASHMAWPLHDREPRLLETVRPGVFAAGDVRAGASNRVAGAVGDGALVVRFAHDLLADETPDAPPSARSRRAPGRPRRAAPRPSQARSRTTTGIFRSVFCW